MTTAQLFPEPERDELALAREMRERREARGLSVGQAAKLAGISSPRWHQLELGQEKNTKTGELRVPKPTPETLGKIADALDWAWPDAVEAAGFAPGTKRGSGKKPSRAGGRRTTTPPDVPRRAPAQQALPDPLSQIGMTVGLDGSVRFDQANGVQLIGLARAQQLVTEGGGPRVDDINGRIQVLMQIGAWVAAEIDRLRQQAAQRTITSGPDVDDE